MSPKTNGAARAALVAVAGLVAVLSLSAPAGLAAFSPAKRVNAPDTRLELVRLAADPARWSGPFPVTVAFSSTPAASTAATTATFAWQATFGATSTCSLDGGRSSSCASPTTLSNLAVGRHTFAVTATRGRTRDTAVAAWAITAPVTAQPKPAAPVPPAPAPVAGSASGGASPSPGAGPPAAAAPVGVAAPSPPLSYVVPAGAVVVSSSAGLVAALKAGPAAVVLADGVYGGPVYFDDWNSSSVYAQHLGGAVLTAGLVVGGNWGPGGATVQGLVFDVSDPGSTFQNSALNVWGASGEQTRVLDTTFDGNWRVGTGLLAMNPDGLVAERLSLAHFTDVGIRASDNQTVAYGQKTAVIESISDISIDGVSRATPGGSGGTAEAGLWIGQPVSAGVRRIRIRDVAWSGIETVNNAWDTTYSDLDINLAGPHHGVGVGVYLEHYSLNDTFTDFAFSGVKVGFNAEWNYGQPGNGAAQNDTIENGSIDAAGWPDGRTSGIYLDEGTGRTTIRNVSFKNQTWAAIGAYKPAGQIAITNNTYELGIGVPAVSSNHP